MSNNGWQQLEEVERLHDSDVIEKKHKTFDELFNSYYYGTLETQTEVEAEKRWQELTGGNNEH